MRSHPRAGRTANPSRARGTLVAAAALCAIGVLAAGAASAGRPRRPSASTTLDALIDRFLEQRWQASPGAATEAGVAGHDDRLPDFSARAVASRSADQRDLLAAVQRLPERTLTPEERIDRQLLIGQLESSIRESQRRPWETNPELYIPFGAISGPVERADTPIAFRDVGL